MECVGKLHGEGRRIRERSSRRSGSGLGFPSRASEREEDRDNECDHDPEIDAASHFWLSLQNLWCRQKKKKKKKREEVILVASYLTCLTGKGEFHYAPLCFQTCTPYNSEMTNLFQKKIILIAHSITYFLVLETPFKIYTIQCIFRFLFRNVH